MPRFALLLLSALLGSCQFAAVPPHYDIGGVHRTVTTTSPEAQLWFDRGLAFCFGFHHEEAVRCFDRALQADPGCAMAHWGKAYALGPNYNATEVPPEACEQAYEATERAAALATNATAKERALIAAMQRRIDSPRAGNRTSADRDYADAMRELHRRHPDDPDIGALTAEAIMQLNPWKLWSFDGKPSAEQPEIQRILESVLATHPEHVAACHLYVHAMEAGPSATRATAAAERLESLAPGLGHLVHMPSHIYIWTGRYQDSIRVNQQAIAADLAFAENVQQDFGYTLYLLHNYHFLSYSAMWTGQRALALRSAREMVAGIPPAALRDMIDFVDIFTATPLHVMVRFGMWDEVLAEPAPAAELLAHRAVWHYARGIALAVLGRTDEARAEQQLFTAARAAVPTTRLLFNNSVADILAVGDAVLDGEIEYRLGHFDRAFVRLREAVRLDDQLNYDEPWGWMEPARHALGALLLEQFKLDEAELVYRDNLRRYPENGWALHGLHECLRKLGRVEQAKQVQERLDRAWRSADIELPGSCFCRTR